LVLIVKTPQKTNVSLKRDISTDEVDSSAEFLILEPAGYPMASLLDDYPEIENPGVFEHYAREQWNGCVVCKGEYLFDKRMYPDFAYRVKEVEPPESVIAANTSIVVNDIETSSTSKVEFRTEITFDDVVGQQIARQKCKLIERYLEDPERFGKWAPSNVLFIGPSGTGKTMLAKALANKTHVPLLPVKSTDMIGEFVGEGSRQIHQLYDRAQDLAPCIIFIDELDAIALDRRNQELRGDVSEIVNALLTEMDGIVERPGVCTIAATNRPASLDPAVRGRFEEEIEFVLPDEYERYSILESNLATFPIDVDDIDLSYFASKTVGLSGRDIVEKFLKTALHLAIMDDGKVVSADDFNTSLKRISKPVAPLNPDGLYV